MEIKYREHLWKLFPKVKQAICVELGVAEGQFSRDMLNWGIKKLYCVDMWEQDLSKKGDVSYDNEWHTRNYENALKLLKPFGDKARILRGPTTKMHQYVSDGECDLVYIDAAHDYQSVRNDIEAWLPKVKKGGIMAFHDFANDDYGVRQAVVDMFDLDRINPIPENKWEDAGAWVKI